jgi:hypothetical protein
MKTRELQALWTEWMGTSEKLTRTLHEQTVALTLRDLPRIQKLQPELETLQGQLVSLDERAAACAKRLAEEMGTEPNLRGLVRVLEKAEAQHVQQLANKVTVSARNLEYLLGKNRKLIENELVYINGTLTLIAKTAEKQSRRYSRGPARSGASILVDQAA